MAGMHGLMRPAITMRLALKMRRNDAPHIKHRRQQMVNQREGIIRFVFAVRIHNHAYALWVGYRKRRRQHLPLLLVRTVRRR